MTIRLGKAGRLLALFGGFIIVLGMIILFLSWLMGTSPSPEQSGQNAPGVSASNVNPDAAPSTKQDTAQIAQALSQTLREIKADREAVLKIKDDRQNGFTKETCSGVEELKKQGGTVLTAQRVAAAAGCPNYLEKLYAYHDKLEQLVTQQDQKITQAEAQIASLNTLPPDIPRTESSADGLSWASLLWITATSIIASLIVFSLVNVKSLAGQREVVGALSEGLNTVNSSLGQLHQVLSLPVESGLLIRGAEIPGQGGLKQEDQRFKQLLSQVSSELHKGFFSLQESFGSIRQSLDAIGPRLESSSERTQSRPPAQQERAVDIQTAQSSPAPVPPQDHHHDDDPVLPRPMLVSSYETEFERVVSVGASYQSGYLEKKQGGELVVFTDKRRETYYLIPDNVHLQTPTHFHQMYAAYYESPEIKPGYIEVTVPAVVQREGERWHLKRKGTLKTQKARD